MVGKIMLAKGIKMMNIALRLSIFNGLMFPGPWSPAGIISWETKSDALICKALARVFSV